MKGNVYVLSNKSLPGVYKIGMTSRSPYDRASELSTTGLPTSFRLEYFISVEQYDLVEKAVHKKLAKFNAGKEFFKCRLEKCISAVRIESDNFYVYDEKFKNNTLMNSVYNYESSNNIYIHKNIEENNIRIQKENKEKERLQKLKEEKEASERKEYLLRKEKYEKDKSEEEKNKNEKFIKKAKIGLPILLISFLYFMTLPNGFFAWLGLVIIFCIWFFNDAI